MFPPSGFRLPTPDHHRPFRPCPASRPGGVGADQLPWCHPRALQVFLPAPAVLHGNRISSPQDWPTVGVISNPNPALTDQPESSDCLFFFLSILRDAKDTGDLTPPPRVKQTRIIHITTPGDSAWRLRFALSMKGGFCLFICRRLHKRTPLQGL